MINIDIIWTPSVILSVCPMLYQVVPAVYLTKHLTCNLPKNKLRVYCNSPPPSLLVLMWLAIQFFQATDKRILGVALTILGVSSFAFVLWNCIPRRKQQDKIL